MNDNLTDRLNRELHEQVDGWHAAPLTLDSVRGRARSIRRTRRMVAAGATAAAVAAIAVPTVLFGTDLTGRSEPPPVVDTPTEAIDTGAPAEESPLDIPFLEGRELTMPDGATAQLPRGYDGAAVLGDQVFGIAQDDQGYRTLERLGDGMAVEERIPIAGSGVAFNAEGTAMTYVRRDGELVIEWAGGTASLGDQGPADPVRVLGGPDCTETVDTCVVYFNREGEEPPRVATNFGAVNEVPGDPVSVKDAAEDGRIAMQTETRIDGSCSGVFDASAEKFAFETCEYSLGTFAPDGAHVSAADAYLSGDGATFAAILDARTGELAARYQPEDGFIWETVWEDAQHLLVLTYDRGSGAWTVVRLATDGSTETALGPSTQGGELDPAYRLLGPG